MRRFAGWCFVSLSLVSCLQRCGLRVRSQSRPVSAKRFESASLQSNNLLFTRWLVWTFAQNLIRRSIGCCAVWAGVQTVTLESSNQTRRHDGTTTIPAHMPHGSRETLFRKYVETTKHSRKLIESAPNHFTTPLQPVRDPSYSPPPLSPSPPLQTGEGSRQESGGGRNRRRSGRRRRGKEIPRPRRGPARRIPDRAKSSGGRAGGGEGGGGGGRARDGGPGARGGSAAGALEEEAEPQQRQEAGGAEGDAQAGRGGDGGPQGASILQVEGEGGFGGGALEVFGRQARWIILSRFFFCQRF